MMYNNNMKYDKIFRKCDAFIVLNPSNLFYFSKYENKDAIILITKNNKYYLTDDRSYEEAKEFAPDFEIVRVLGYDNFQKLREILVTEKVNRVGFEEEEISYTDYKKINIDSYSLISVSEEIKELRLVKTEEEIEKIKAAQAITDKVYSEILNHVKEGMTEIELASKLEGLLFEYGASGLAFSSIVAFGKNTSKPHAHRTNNKLKKGDFITLDFGATLGGYCSDMTRTFAFGKIGEKEKDIYNKVLEAQKLALDNVKAGLFTHEADAFARDYFKKFNLQDYFTHSLGHGLGIDVHEDYRLSKNTQDKIEENHIYTIEPGLYLPGEFGVRIEDMVVIKNNGAINLTKSTKKFIIL